MMRLSGAALLALSLVACGDDGGSCPPVDQEQEYLASGDYVSEGGEPRNWYCSELDPCEAVFPPHQDVSPIDMEMDLAAGRVIMRYERDGQTVVERWRITRRRFQ